MCIRDSGGAAIAATQDINDFLALEGGKYGKGILNAAKTKIVLNLEDEEAQRVKMCIRDSNSIVEKGVSQKLALFYALKSIHQEQINKKEAVKLMKQWSRKKAEQGREYGKRCV